MALPHPQQGLEGGWHDAWLCCCLQLAAPVGLSPLNAALPLNPSFYRRRRPSTSHRLVPSLPLLGLSLPPYSPFLSLGRLCQRSPRTVPVSLLCQVRPRSLILESPRGPHHKSPHGSRGNSHFRYPIDQWASASHSHSMPNMEVPKMQQFEGNGALWAACKVWECKWTPMGSGGGRSPALPVAPPRPPPPSTSQAPFACPPQPAVYVAAWVLAPGGRHAEIRSHTRVKT